MLGSMGCNYRPNNSFFGVWCVIKYEHHSTHQHPNYNPSQLWGWVIDELGFCQPIEFDIATSLLCFGYDPTILQVVGVGALTKS